MSGRLTRISTLQSWPTTWRKKKDGEWDRWGLISAPFGKMSNLKEYMYAVLKTYIGSFGSNDSIQQYKGNYISAAHRFKRQYEKVRQMEQELQQISGAGNVL